MKGLTEDVVDPIEKDSGLVILENDAITTKKAEPPSGGGWVSSAL